MAHHISLTAASALALFAGAAFFIQPAAALTITFDDLADTSGGLGGAPIPNGYQGLNWTNWNVLNTALFTTNFLGGNPSGALPGTVSPPNVAYNPTGGEAILSSSTPFTFNGADLTALWNDNLQVTVTGLLGGVMEDTITLSPSAAAATLETFNWANIDEVELLAVGGTPHAGYSGAGTQVLVDNLTVTPTPTPTPEPSTLAILGAGLAGLGVLRWRRKTA
jgi:hypothetical protein